MDRADTSRDQDARRFRGWSLAPIASSAGFGRPDRLESLRPMHLIFGRRITAGLIYWIKYKIR